MPVRFLFRCTTLRLGDIVGSHLLRLPHHALRASVHAAGLVGKANAVGVKSLRAARDQVGALVVLGEAVRRAELLGAVLAIACDGHVLLAAPWVVAAPLAATSQSGAPDNR